MRRTRSGLLTCAPTCSRNPTVQKSAIFCANMLMFDLRACIGKFEQAIARSEELQATLVSGGRVTRKGPRLGFYR